MGEEPKEIIELKHFNQLLQDSIKSLIKKYCDKENQNPETWNTKKLESEIEKYKTDFDSLRKKYYALEYQYNSLSDTLKAIKAYYSRKKSGNPPNPQKKSQNLGRKK